MDIRLVAGATAERKVLAKNDNGRSGMRIALIPAMSFALALLVLTCGAVAAIVDQLRRAPEAFEDETGFHFSLSTGNRLPEESILRRRGTPGSIGIAVRRVREAH